MEDSRRGLLKFNRQDLTERRPTVANKYNEGRADAAEGKKTLPADPNAWQVFKSDKQIANERESNATYREGHADKTREMNDTKKK
jgi:hypothetical protein